MRTNAQIKDGGYRKLMVQFRDNSTQVQHDSRRHAKPTQPHHERKLEPPINSTQDARLPRQQMNVLRLIAGGAGNKRIASELQISINTVRAHIHSMLRLLDLSNRTELVQVAIRLGILPCPCSAATKQPTAKRDNLMPSRRGGRE